MAQTNWEADKMLDVYIHDYLLKKKLLNSAKTFMAEGKVATDPIAIDAPGGFLFEWWSVFWDIFISRSNVKHSDPAAAYIESQKIKIREQQQQQQQQQQLQMHHNYLMQQRNAQLQRRDPNHPPLAGPMNTMNPEGSMGQPSANVLAMRLHEERMKHPHSMDSDASSSLLDASRLALLKSPTNHQGQLIQNNPVGMSPALQPIQGRPQMVTDIKGEGNLGPNQKSLPVDPSAIYGQSMLQAKPGLGGAGMNQGVTGLPLKGWPLTGIEQLRPSMGLQVQKPNLQGQNQYALSSQQQHALAQAQAQGNLSSPPNYGFGGMARGNFSTKEGQHPRNDGPICSPGQSNSPQMKMTQMQQQSSSQQQDQLQHQQRQVEQSNRKRKQQQASSGAANSTGTGNTAGPSPTSPQSTHTPGGDGIDTSSSLQRISSVSKPFMYGADGARGMHSSASANQLDDLDNFGDVGPLEDNVESFLSQDGEDENIYGAPKQTPSDLKTDTSKSIFGEFGCIRTRNKVLCCHFSSDGKILASGGHDKKAVLWNMDTLKTESTPEEHNHLITDVRFRPNSTQLVTASFDKSVRLWDAANPSYCLHAYTGHASPIMSLDFHPKKNDLFCFSDTNSEIRYWNINPFTCCRVSKQGGNRQVRFQPSTGNLLAAASDNVVSVYDVENDRQIHSFQEHSGEVNFVSWHLNGDYLACVTKESVKVWSMGSRELIHELVANEGQFHSCVFHPNYPALLVIGGTKTLELWNIVENRRMTINAHDNIITALAQSPVTGIVASASHDSSVKLWK